MGAPRPQLHIASTPLRVRALRVGPHGPKSQDRGEIVDLLYSPGHDERRATCNTVLQHAFIVFRAVIRGAYASHALERLILSGPNGKPDLSSERVGNSMNSEQVVPAGDVALRPPALLRYLVRLFDIRKNEKPLVAKNIVTNQG
jgi:hypothetical protein